MMADYKKKVVQEKDRLEKKANSMLYSRKQENAAKDTKGGGKGKSKDNKKDKKSKSKSSKKSSSKTGEADKIIDRVYIFISFVNRIEFNKCCRFNYCRYGLRKNYLIISMIRH